MIMTYSYKVTAAADNAAAVVASISAERGCGAGGHAQYRLWHIMALLA
jgi:hypothetical protein